MSAFYSRLLDHEIPTQDDIYYAPFSGKGFWLRPVVPFDGRILSGQYFDYFSKTLMRYRQEIKNLSDQMDTFEAVLRGGRQ